MRFHWIVGLIVGSGVWLVGATQTFAKDDRLPYFKQPPSVQYDSDTRIATPYDVLDGPTYAVGAETRYGFQETALDSGTHGLPAHSVTLINSTLYFTDTTTPGWQQSNLRRGVAGRSTTELLLGKSPNNPPSPSTLFATSYQQQGV